MCVCCLTAALIRPLWVRLIGPVIRDAALPPSPARWITSHCRLLRFQDKWTEGESITPQEEKGERDRGRDRIPYRDTDEDTEVGKGRKKVKSKKGNLDKKRRWGGGTDKEEVNQTEEASQRGRQKEVWWGQLQRPAARSAPLPCPCPPHRLGVRVWAFLCSAVSQLFVTVSDLMLHWINHAEALWVVCTVYMCPCVCLNTKRCLCVYIHEYMRAELQSQEKKHVRLNRMPR